MSSFQLDNEGELQITNNSLTLTEGVEAIRQHLKARFQLFLGEWFLDTDIGVPWFRDILIKKPSFVVVQEILKNTVLDTPGVLELTAFEFDFNSTIREANFEFSCLTDEGPIDFSQIIEIG